MLHVTLPDRELFNEEKQEFIMLKCATLQLEHSLISLSRWESKWCKPFLGKDGKTDEETIDYIRCMTVSQNVSPESYLNIPVDIFNQITAYIGAPMTATWFNDPPNSPKSKEIVTAELIYYWMIVHNIPMECQKWHLNRLMTLIRVCNIKNQPPKKMGKREMIANRSALNEARRAQSNTKG